MSASIRRWSWRAVLLNALIALSGCGSIQCIGPQKPLPSWFTEPPSAAHSLAASGEGISLQEAKHEAFNNLASQISSSIASEANLTMIQDGNYVREVFESHTQVVVSDITLASAQITRQHQQRCPNRYYALAQLAKSALVIQQQAALQRDSSTLRQVLDLNKEPSFSSWWRLQEKRNIAERQFNNTTLLKIFDGDNYRKDEGVYARYKQSLDHNSKFKAVGLNNETKIRSLDALVSQQLANEDIRMKKARKKSAFISLSLKYETQRIGSETYVDGTLWLRLIDKHNDVLSQFHVKDSVVVYGRNKGHKALHQKLYRKLEQTDILQTLINNA